ncbi:cache domain-containing sensor histidine kinase [Paenibacillus sp. 1P07SE]|uniref:cache domain-containing sensor histidine kinase n=1 Tax=Paenibacillus sp. 1P07SE TaxID=3132209 RepID=UPI0039A602E5
MNKLGMKGLTYRSLGVQIPLIVLMMTIPLIVMLLYNNFYAIDVVRTQVAESYKNTLRLYMGQIDSNLNDVDAYLNTIAGSGYDLIALKRAETDDQYYISKAYLFNRMSNDISLFNTLDSFFVYAKDRQDYMDVYATGVSFEEKERVQAYITEMIKTGNIPQGLRTKRWHPTRIGEVNYLVNIIQSGRVYLGGWIRTDTLLEPLKDLDVGEGGVMLVADASGEPITGHLSAHTIGLSLNQVQQGYQLSGSDQQYLVVDKESYRGSFSLVTLIPDREILANLPYLQQLIWFITLGSFLFIPIGLYLIRRTFFVPLKRILHAMSRVRSGDWSVRVDTDKNAEEFKILGYSFNSMMIEIQTLRVNVFEEQLNKQREELQRLQLQVNPHFFLNALNIVYNLAKVKNHTLILEMTMALIQYFRFLFRSNTSFVKLGDELQHTRNYLRIQALRFPDKLLWNVDAPAYFMDVPVPPLIIQSFVENSIKHAVTLEEPIEITVKVAFADEDGVTIGIRITDTGEGFDEHVLRELKAGRSLENEQGEHTGIWNVQRRLKLLYGEEASIQYENDRDTGGAVVEVVVPTYAVMEGRR